jgi:hypothetical protein
MTAVLSLLNRTSIRSSNTTPLTINIVLDLFLSFAIGIWAVRAIDNASQAFGYARCGRDYYGPGDEERSCIGWLIAAGCLVGAGILGGAVVGWVSFALQFGFRV